MRRKKDSCENCKNCMTDGAVYICLRCGARTTGDQVCKQYKRDDNPQKMPKVVV